ncbi:hypothetical protein HF521_012506 [Silurus meridionalis]|uniref:Uncharacterized protein n=1 Tax=Silurus meridionalis TaxID=175797 RepID=A0A8T0ACS3_SILME|nr:hypothetical protein HF521_012506 [Silurus meridionalis]
MEQLQDCVSSKLLTLDKPQLYKVCQHLKCSEPGDKGLSDNSRRALIRLTERTLEEIEEGETEEDYEGFLNELLCFLEQYEKPEESENPPAEPDEISELKKEYVELQKRQDDVRRTLEEKIVALEARLQSSRQGTSRRETDPKVTNEVLIEKLGEAANLELERQTTLRKAVTSKPLKLSEVQTVEHPCESRQLVSEAEVRENNNSVVRDKKKQGRGKDADTDTTKAIEDLKANVMEMTKIFRETMEATRAKKSDKPEQYNDSESDDDDRYALRYRFPPGSDHTETDTTLNPEAEPFEPLAQRTEPPEHFSVHEEMEHQDILTAEEDNISQADNISEKEDQETECEQERTQSPTYPQRQRHQPKMLTYDALGEPTVIRRTTELKELSLQPTDGLNLWRPWG